MSVPPNTTSAQSAAPSAVPSGNLRITSATSPSRRTHSSSMPATPSQRPVTNGIHHRSPSGSRTLNNNSPLSESSQILPQPRKRPGGCPYETAMAKARRRIPYAMGPEKLSPEPAQLRKQLTGIQEERLSRDIQTLYEKLLPTPESEGRRARFVEKLEKILHDRWPSSAIKVNVFGSTGNDLGTSDSDVDICITTDSVEMTRVCSIADLMAKNGMERVVCVSSAKVPIVKLWDSELQVACDLNVNNPIALENTAMIKNYVAVDHRVRPFAMIIKYWAKRRILNDAALGATLSSYTWICLALNYLQTRNPPVLPSLQLQPHVKEQRLGGVNVAFDKDLNAYRDFGKANQASVGQLLFGFFRYYGYELDFERSIISVRQGKVTSKTETSWALLQNNRLCVEEPFNTTRNLANTADDTSMRGIHLEIRRAFSLIVGGQLDTCCEQYEYPAEEPKASIDFIPPKSNPIVAQAPPVAGRGGRGGVRGGRNTRLGHHYAGNTRRSSNPLGRGQPVQSGQTGYLRNLPFQMTTQELQLQAQHQQHLLHDQLFQQYQALQYQEQELRARLKRGALASAGYQTPQAGLYGGPDENTAASAAGNAMPNRIPMSAPLHQQRFASPYLQSALPASGISTNPSSPHLSPALLDLQRFSRRTSVTQSSAGAALRAQSQPARAFPMHASMSSSQSGVDLHEYFAGRRSSASSNTNDSVSYPSRAGLAVNPYEISRRPAEYLGYFVGRSPSLMAYPTSASISPLPAHAGLAIHHGGLSPRSAAASPQPSLGGATLVPPMSELSSNGSNPGGVQESRGPSTADGRNTRSPPSVNSTANVVSHASAKAARGDVDDPLTFSASTSEDLAFDTPSSSDDNFPEVQQNIVSHGQASNSLQPRQVDVAAQRETNEESQGRPASQAQKPALVPYPLGRQLSVVQEVRTPSPGTDRGHRASVSISSTRSQNKVQPGRANGVKSANNSPAIGAPSPTSHGGFASKGTPNAGSQGENQWEVPKRRRHQKKKTVKSENDAQPLNLNGGESPPLLESERKGG